MRGEHILPYSNTVCGIRVKDVSSASAAIWTLEAENDYGDYEQDSITIQILPLQKSNFETRVQLEVGKSTIRCSKPDTAKHCKIVDLYYGGTYHECELYTTIHPSSIYDCYVFNWGRMEQSHERIFVDTVNATAPYTNATTTDNDDALILGCEFRDKVYSCQAEMPDHRTELLLMDGAYNGHYSAYDTE